MALILINGLGRSGTSWVHKTFDQHPNVFASFEPESLVEHALKKRLRDEDDDAAARDYVDALFSCRGLRAMRKRPILKKPYRSGPAHVLRLSYIYAMSLLGKVLPFAERRILAWPVPELANLDGVTRVVKSVSQQYELARLVRVAPDMKVIYLVRHPCGQVYSHMRGLLSGKMFENYLPPRSDMQRLFDFDRPAKDLVEADFDQLEINAYRWAVYNDVNYRAMVDLPNARLVTYEHLCADPRGVFRDIFEWAGLDFHERCARFIDLSLTKGGDAHIQDYHALVRNPMAAANKWREDMDPSDADRVKVICRRSAAAALFDDLE